MKSGWIRRGPPCLSVAASLALPPPHQPLAFHVRMEEADIVWARWMMYCGTNGHMVRELGISRKEAVRKPKRGTGLVWNVVLLLQRGRFGKCSWLYLDPRCAHYFFGNRVHPLSGFLHLGLPGIESVGVGGGWARVTVRSKNTNMLKWKVVN